MCAYAYYYERPRRAQPCSFHNATCTWQAGGGSSPIAFYAYLFFGHVGRDEMWTTKKSHCHMLLICRHWSLKPHSWYSRATCSFDCVVIRPWTVYQEHQLQAWWCQYTTGANHDTSKYETNFHFKEKLVYLVFRACKCSYLFLKEYKKLRTL